MLFVLLSCMILLQVNYAYPEWITIPKTAAMSDHYANYQPIESRSYLSMPNFNLLQWLNRKDSKEEKLDALFEILKCMTESNEFTECKTVVKKVKSKFEDEEEKPKMRPTVAPEQMEKTVGTTKATEVDQ